MTEQILSQEEIDALLNAMETGEVEVAEEKPPEKKEVKAYDLTAQSVMLRDQFDALDEVYDKFINLMSGELSTTLQRSLEVKVASKEVVKFGEFLKAFSNPTGFAMFNMEPLIGSALIVIEPNLVFSMIDCMFGGDGKPLPKVREFTVIEQRMLRRFFLDILKNLQMAWKVAHTLNINLRKTETKPEFVHLVNPGDLMIVVVFTISGDEFSGNLHLATPYLMLEPIKEQLTSSYLREKDRASSFGNQIKQLLKKTDVNIIAELGKNKYSVRDILSFDVDDVIKLNTGPEDLVTLKVEHVPKFLGMPGVVKGSRAVQISALIDENGSN
ncbi:MAG: flagellar motor switch protein FliM [Desulfobacteraceae bacterium]|nr:flagellar motor switch protein FliM [Desulfobacteraceae bacterium]